MVKHHFDKMMARKVDKTSKIGILQLSMNQEYKKFGHSFKNFSYKDIASDNFAEKC